MLPLPDHDALGHSWASPALSCLHPSPSLTFSFFFFLHSPLTCLFCSRDIAQSVFPPFSLPLTGIFLFPSLFLPTRGHVLLRSCLAHCMLSSAMADWSSGNAAHSLLLKSFFFFFTLDLKFFHRECCMRSSLGSGTGAFVQRLQYLDPFGGVLANCSTFCTSCLSPAPWTPGQRAWKGTRGWKCRMAQT